MLKQKTIIEVKIGEHSYELQCSPDSPLGELFDAVCQMRMFIFQKIQENMADSPKETEEEQVKDA